ncbi:MAG: OadG family protein [Faecousia sp.]
MQNWFVVVMGIGTVFVVLVLIIALCYLLGLICRAGAKEEQSKPSPVSDAPAAIPNRAELAAAIAAAVAEYSGTDASAIRILSIKKL